MKRLWLALLVCCAGLCLFLGTPALSGKPTSSGKLKSLISTLAKLPPEDLLLVLGSIPVAPVPVTGQSEAYCDGDDGFWMAGISWPETRFTDNVDGTVRDNLTGLVWTRNANMFGSVLWQDDPDNPTAYPACDACAALSDETSEDLTDGSVAGDWRLANVKELQSLISYGVLHPALPLEHPFLDVQDDYYWSSTSFAPPEGPGPELSMIIIGNYAWGVNFSDGEVWGFDKSSVNHYVWCVRGGITGGGGGTLP